MQEIGRDRVNAVETSFDIIEALRRLDRAGVTELANELGRTKSTVFRHLATLDDLGYVLKENDEYRLGHRFLGLGFHVQHQKKEYTFVEEKVLELSEETTERVQFIVEDHGRGIYLFQEGGSAAVNIDRKIGSSIDLHVAAAGKAILAFLPEEKREWVLNEYGLSQRTENTITDSEAMIEELEAIRERGYAFNLEEYTPGLRSVGVPIRDEQGHVFGAISIAAPANRMKDHRLKNELPELLLGAANEIELRNKYETS